MDIVCPKCSTEYEFDDDRVTEAGVAVKCTTCDYTFKVRRRQQPSSPVAGTDDKRWMIRTLSGALLKFKELTTLQQWIVERKVTRDDQISRSGETWKALGDIAELSSFFMVVDAAETAAETEPADGAEDFAQPDQEDHELGAAGAEPAFAASAQLGVVGGTAAWEGGGGRLGETGDEIESPIRRRNPGKWAAIVLGLLVVVGAAAFVVLQPQVVKGLFSSLFSKGEVSQAYRKGREAFLRDDLASLKLADRHLAQAPKGSALARAARAEVFCAWAQRLRDLGELKEREARGVEAQVARLQKPPTPPAPEPTKRGRRRRGPTEAERQAAEKVAAQVTSLMGRAKELHRAASTLRQDAKQKLQVAEAHVQAATAGKSDRAEVYRAVAELHRLSGQGDVLALIAKVRKTVPDDPESFYVEALYRLQTKDTAAAVKLLKTAIIKTKAYSKQILLRGVFQLGMMHLRAGRHTEARQQVDLILGTNANHQLARTLLARIAAEQEQPLVDAGQTAPSKAAVAPIAPAPAATAVKPATPSVAIPAAPKGPVVTSYSGLVKAGFKAAEYGRSGKALRYYEQALKLNPKGIEALIGIGYCELDVQRLSTALFRFRQALNLSSANGDAMLGMAATYKALGNQQKALDYYRAFVRTHPGAAKARMAKRNILELERKLGKTAPAPAPAPKAPEPAAPPKVPVPAADPNPTPASPAPSEPAPASPPPAKAAPASPPPAKAAPASPPPAKAAPAKPAPASPPPAKAAPASPAP